MDMPWDVKNDPKQIAVTAKRQNNFAWFRVMGMTLLLLLCSIFVIDKFNAACAYTFVGSGLRSTVTVAIV